MAPHRQHRLCVHDWYVTSLRMPSLVSRLAKMADLGSDECKPHSICSQCSSTDLQGRDLIAWIWQSPPPSSLSQPAGTSQLHEHANKYATS